MALVYNIVLAKTILNVIFKFVALFMFAINIQLKQKLKGIMFLVTQFTKDVSLFSNASTLLWFRQLCPAKKAHKKSKFWNASMPALLTIRKLDHTITETGCTLWLLNFVLFLVLDFFFKSIYVNKCDWKWKQLLLLFQFPLDFHHLVL